MHIAPVYGAARAMYRWLLLLRSIFELTLQVPASSSSSTASMARSAILAAPLILMLLMLSNRRRACIGAHLHQDEDETHPLRQCCFSPQTGVILSTMFESSQRSGKVATE